MVDSVYTLDDNGYWPLPFRIMRGETLIATFRWKEDAEAFLSKRTEHKDEPEDNL